MEENGDGMEWMDSPCFENRLFWKPRLDPVYKYNHLCLSLGKFALGGEGEGLCTIYLKETQPPARNTAHDIALWYISDSRTRFDDPSFSPASHFIKYQACCPRKWQAFRITVTWRIFGIL